MANNLYGFLLNNEGPEQSYGIVDSNLEEQERLLQTAVDGGVELVAVYEAEGSCIGIMPRRVAEVLVSHLNAQERDVLEPLGFVGDVLPQDVIDIRKEQNG